VSEILFTRLLRTRPLSSSRPLNAVCRYGRHIFLSDPFFGCGHIPPKGRSLCSVTRRSLQVPFLNLCHGVIADLFQLNMRDVGHFVSRNHAVDNGGPSALSASSMTSRNSPGLSALKPTPPIRRVANARKFLRLFRRARKLQIRSDLRPTPWLTRQSAANLSQRTNSLLNRENTVIWVENGPHRHQK
jgi:hypothetical protein